MSNTARLKDARDALGEADQLHKESTVLTRFDFILFLESITPEQSSTAFESADPCTVRQLDVLMKVTGLDSHCHPVPSVGQASRRDHTTSSCCQLRRRHGKRRLALGTMSSPSRH